MSEGIQGAGRLRLRECTDGGFFDVTRRFGTTPQTKPRGAALSPDRRSVRVEPILCGFSEAERGHRLKAEGLIRAEVAPRDEGPRGGTSAPGRYDTSHRGRASRPLQTTTSPSWPRDRRQPPPDK